MPCDQVILNQIELGKMNDALLRKALEALGARGLSVGSGAAWFILDGVRCQIVGGKLQVPEGSEHLADKLKVAYSRETVKYTAKRNGWTLKETRPNVFAVIK
jgi:hypothetical protein